MIQQLLLAIHTMHHHFLESPPLQMHPSNDKAIQLSCPWVSAGIMTWMCCMLLKSNTQTWIHDTSFLSTSTLTCLHVRHVRRLRYWPWKRLTMILLFLSRYLSQAMALACQSGNRSNRASSSGSSGRGEGRRCTKLTSSCNPSNKKTRNSWESCWSVPENWGANGPSASYSIMSEANTTHILSSITLNVTGEIKL